MLNNLIAFQKSWLLPIVFTYTILVGSACKKNNQTPPVVEPPRTNVPITLVDEPKSGDLDPSTNGLHSVDSVLSGVSGTNTSSKGSSSSFSSRASSGYGSSSSTSSGYNPPTEAPRVLPDFAGLPNLGVTCYMNSVLQIIAALYKDEVQGTSLEKLIHKINNTHQPLNQSDIEEFIKELPDDAQKMARSGQQEDPYGFIICLMEVVKFLYPINCTESLFFKKADNLIYKFDQKPNFHTTEPGYSCCLLPIPILPNASGLSEMIQGYQNSFVEKGTGLNGVNLDKLVTPVKEDPLPLPFYIEAYQAALNPVKDGSEKDYIAYRVFDALPKKLCIHVPRLDCNNNKNNNKITDLVDGAMDITIQPDPNKQDKVSFNLNGFIEHRGGGTTSGHYVAYVKRKGKWYEANDEQVTEISTSQAKEASTKAYLLFYGK